MAEISREDAIKKELKVAEESQKVVDTHIVFVDDSGNNVSVEEIYADDTEIINAHLSNYQYCADYHKFIAEELQKLEKVEQIVNNQDELIIKEYGVCIPEGYADLFEMITQIVKEV